MKRKKHLAAKRLQAACAVVLAVLLALPANLTAFASSPAGGDEAQAPEPLSASSEGFEVSLSWAKAADPVSMEWVSASDETRVLRLMVAYSNADPVRSYAPGEVSISVPGIAGIGRDEPAVAADVAADEAASAQKTRDWSYAYDAESDVYTFTNNASIQAGEALSGSFEVLWSVESRDAKTGYTAELVATLVAPGAEARSNAASLSYTAEKDAYAVSVTTSALAGPDGLGEDYADYIWVRYSITSSRTLAARGLDDASWHVSLPEGAKVAAVRSSGGAALNYSTGKDGACVVPMRSSLTYWYSSSQPQVIVGYPRSQFEDREAVARVSLVGTYADSEQQETVASTDVERTLRADDYSFTYAGGAYSLYKSHYVSDKILHRDLARGTSFTYTLTARARVEPGEPQDIEVIDDFQDVLLNDGSLRQLDEGEYSLLSVQVPSASGIKNGNSLPIASGVYGYEVLADAGDGFTPVQDGLIGAASVNVALPEGTSRAMVRMTGLKETVNATFTVRASYRISDEDPTAPSAVSSDGFIRNTASLTARDAAGNVLNPADRGSYTGSNAEEVAARDIASYGRYLQRDHDDAPITASGNWAGYTEVSSSGFTGDKEGYRTSVTVSSRTNQADATPAAEVVKQFMMLPAGMEVDVDSFGASFTAAGIKATSGTRLDQAYIADHVSYDITRNWRGTGRVMVALTYDFSDDPLIMSSGSALMAKFDVGIPTEAYMEHGDAYKLEAATIYDEADPNQSNYHTHYTDNGACGGIGATEVWADLDGDGDTAEFVSYASSTPVITLARATHQSIRETVRTDHSDGAFVLDSYANAGEGYTWRLSLITGSTNAGGLVLVDTLSEGEWQGAFAGLDTSFLEASGYAPRVLYSVRAAPSADIASADWVEAGSWAQPLSEVRSFAVSLDDQVVPAGSLVYVLANMEAPRDEGLFGRPSADAFTARFDNVDPVTGSVTGEVVLESQPAQVRLLDEVGTLTIVKTDAVTGRRLAGATFEVRDSQGSVVASDLHTNTQGKAVVAELPYGDYTVAETGAPSGYKVAKAPSIVTVSGQEAECVVSDERQTASVTFAKSDASTGGRVSDAKFELEVWDGSAWKKVSTLVTGEDGVALAQDVPWGTYRLTEVECLGYEVDPQPYYFNVTMANAKGDLEPVVVGPVTGIVNKQIPSSIHLTKTELTPDGISTGNPVDGAVYALYTPEGKLVRTGYTTATDGTLTISGVPFGDYYVAEAEPAVGYEFNPERYPVSFTRQNAGATVEIVTTDTQKTSDVTLRKHDAVTDERLEGAVYELRRASGEIVVDGIVTDERGQAMLEGLPWGDYALHEVKAPAGFELAKDPVTFTVSRDNVEGEITVDAYDTRALGSATLVKLDGRDRTTPLPGAVYSLYRTDGTLVAADLTTGEDGTAEVTGLEWGGYYFQETSAPTGYSVSAEKVRFAVNASTAQASQRVVAYDDADDITATVVKRILADDVWWPNGSPAFVFSLENDATGEESYASVSFAEGQRPDEEGYLTARATFSGLLPNATYTVSELPTLRYAIESAAGGTAAASGDSVSIDTSDGQGSYEAVFVNDRTTSEGVSDVQSLSNLVAAQAAYTGITAEWTGGVLSDREIDKALISASLTRDDGAVIPLEPDEFEVTPSEIPGGVSGTYLVKVSSHGFSADLLIDVDIPKCLADYSAAELKVVADDLAAKAEKSQYWEEFNHYLDIDDRWYWTLNDEAKTRMSFRIIGINHDTKAGGSDGLAGLTMQAVELMPSTYPFNDTTTGTHAHWVGSTLQEQMNEPTGTIYKELEGLLRYVTPVEKKHRSVPLSSEDTFWLASNGELSEYTFGNGAGMCYQFYWGIKPPSDLLKKCVAGSNNPVSWWTRDGLSTADRVAAVAPNGNTSGGQAVTTPAGVAPCFCFGQAPTPDIYIDDNGRIIPLEDVVTAADDISANGEASPYYNQYHNYLLNDTRMVIKNWGDGNSYEARIIGINHDDKSDGTGKAGLTFQFVSVLQDDKGWGSSYKMNSTDNTAGGWEACDLRKAMNDSTGEIWQQIPEELATSIIAVDKQTNNVGPALYKNENGDKEFREIQITSTSDRLFIPSVVECVGPFKTETNAGEKYQPGGAYSYLSEEGEQYEYYESQGTRWRSSSNCDLTALYKWDQHYNRFWALRSLDESNDRLSYIVPNVGATGLSYTVYNGPNYISPCFCIGTETPPPDIYIKDGNRYIGIEEIRDAADDISANGVNSRYYEQYHNYLLNDVHMVISNWGDGNSYEARIIGINHDDKSDGTGKAGLTFQFANLLETEYRMNPTRTNAGGWEACDLRSKMNDPEGEIWSQVPDSLSKNIISVNKKNLAGTTSDRLWLASTAEMCSATNIGNNNYLDEGPQYEYYANLIGNDAYSELLKMQTPSGVDRDYFLRTADRYASDTGTHFSSVTTVPGVFTTIDAGEMANYPSGIAPCFCY